MIKKAIREGYLTSWPGLSINTINKLLEPDYAILGHVDYVRKNKLSTKSKENKKHISEWDLKLETHAENKTHDFFMKL